MEEEDDETLEMIITPEEMTLRQILDYMKQNLTLYNKYNGEELVKKYDELQKIVDRIDLSVLDSIDDENAASSSIPKRRKTSRAGSESNDGQLLGRTEKCYEELKKQIDFVKKALNVIYDMQDGSFKRILSKNNKAYRPETSRVPLLKKIEEYGRTLPLWVSIDGKKPPPLCGALKAESNYISNVGDMVAALGKEGIWILAEVIDYDSIKREYTVDDVYEKQKSEQILSWNKVIPLPSMRADPQTHLNALFQKHEKVLALYPSTTCFYHAIVGELPVNPEDPYKLYFEGDNHEFDYSQALPVHQRYVIHNR